MWNLIYFILLFTFVLYTNASNEDVCFNTTENLWNSLDIWNNNKLFEKWKNDPVYNLSTSCNKELKEMIDNAFLGSLWAVKMFDASGHYERSLFEGSESYLGSNSLCQNLEQSRSDSKILNASTEQQFYRKTFENRMIFNYNYINSLSVPPFPVKFAVIKYYLKYNKLCNLKNQTENVISIGICLPKSCKSSDIHTTLKWASRKDFVNILSVRILSKDSSFWINKRFLTLSIIFLIILLFITIGTSLEFLTSKTKRKFSVNLWYKLLHSFSLRENLKSIFFLEVGEDTLAPIHGLKFISISWVVFVHTCLMLFQVAANKKIRDQSEEHVLYQTISNGAYSVDTFFTLSGVLVSFLFFRTVSKYSIKKLIGKDGCTGHILFYISMLIYRLIRLSFPYIVIVILTGFLSELKLSNASLELPNKDHINCVNYWWRNLLYINTFYPVGDMCMIWSWYLSNDTQFFVLGVIILIIALYSEILALVLGTVLVILSWITTAVISYQTHHVIDVRDPFANYDELYDKPWTRLGPYFIGMTTGWLLFHINCCLKIRRRLNYFLWLWALLIIIFLMYAPIYFSSSQIFGIIYTSLSHSIWSLAISWILVSCVTGNGFWINYILSWKYFYPLSRLSYCVYLIHPLLIRIILMSSDSTIFISEEIVAVFFMGFLFFSLLFALILSLTFESPIISLLRLAHPIKKVQ